MIFFYYLKTRNIIIYLLTLLKQEITYLSTINNESYDDKIMQSPSIEQFFFFTNSFLTQ